MFGLQVSRHTATAAVGVLCAIPVCWAGIAFGQNAVIRRATTQTDPNSYLTGVDGTPLPRFVRDWDGRAIPYANRWVVIAPTCDSCSAAAFSWDSANRVGGRTNR